MRGGRHVERAARGRQMAWNCVRRRSARRCPCWADGRWCAGRLSKGDGCVLLYGRCQREHNGAWTLSRTVSKEQLKRKDEGKDGSGMNHSGRGCCSLKKGKQLERGVPLAGGLTIQCHVTPPHTCTHRHRQSTPQPISIQPARLHAQCLRGLRVPDGSSPPRCVRGVRGCPRKIPRDPTLVV